MSKNSTYIGPFGALRFELFHVIVGEDIVPSPVCYESVELEDLCQAKLMKKGLKQQGSRKMLGFRDINNSEQRHSDFVCKGAGFPARARRWRNPSPTSQAQVNPNSQTLNPINTKP